MNMGLNDSPKRWRTTKSQGILTWQKRRKSQIHAATILGSRILKIIVLKFVGLTDV